MEPEKLYDLYTAACKADEAFQRELVRQHGKHAGTRRYQESLDDAETAKARQAARAAGRALRGCYEAR